MLFHISQGKMYSIVLEACTNTARFGVKLKNLTPDHQGQRRWHSKAQPRAKLDNFEELSRKIMLFSRLSEKLLFTVLISNSKMSSSPVFTREPLSQPHTSPPRASSHSCLQRIKAALRSCC